MAPRKHVIWIALISAGVGATLISVIAAYFRRRKRNADTRPDVLNEAHPLDLTLNAAGGLTDKLVGDVDEMGDGNLSLSHRSFSTLSSRASSAATLTFGNTSHYTTQQLCHLGNQHLQRAEKMWEEALAKASLEITPQTTNMERLRTILAKVRELQALYQTEFESDVALGAALDALQEMDADYERKHGQSMTSDGSVDSFVSAAETPDLSDLEEKIHTKSVGRLHLYEVGLLELQHNSVPYRKLRTKIVGCGSDSEFLAKLHVLRIAFDDVMSVESNKKWFMDTGKTIITRIMNKADRDPSDFLLAMEKLEQFLLISSNFDIMKMELGLRGVKCFTLYDVVLDWVLMDAFDDLCNPPGSVLSVVQNRWLSTGLKETAITTAVWSILKAKRRLLKYPEGFIAKFYAITESVSPVLVWAFLGPDGDVKSACQAFKNQCMGFIQDLFNQSKVRYTVYEEMTVDIMTLARQRAALAMSALDGSKTAHIVEVVSTQHKYLLGLNRCLDNVGRLPVNRLSKFDIPSFAGS